MSASLTAAATLQLAVRFTTGRGIEGGATEDPRDHGGPTGAGGVSLRAVRLRDFDHDGLLDFDLNRDGVVNEADMRLIQPADVARLALEDYWRPAACYLFPPRIAVALFDTAWHAGPRRALALLQRGLGIRDDGIPGPVTLSAARANPEALALFLVQRYGFHQRSPQVSEYPGWLKRVMMLAEYCGGIPA